MKSDRYFRFYKTYKHKKNSLVFEKLSEFGKAKIGLADMT